MSMYLLKFLNSMFIDRIFRKKENNLNVLKNQYTPCLCFSTPVGRKMSSVPKYSGMRPRAKFSTGETSKPTRDDMVN